MLVCTTVSSPFFHRLIYLETSRDIILVRSWAQLVDRVSKILGQFRDLLSFFLAESIIGVDPIMLTLEASENLFWLYYTMLISGDVFFIYLFCLFRNQKYNVKIGYVILFYVTDK